ncbi:hypothetical protein [Pedobacter sp. Leaf132]|uniref:hypothetical protein n=1 Tax=Pedobacter sp. Leaf132 TaxID=2876557 RepID=UPI001E354743|nr:hypothetical protein [Pedobacter sp. Leaf132]
MNTIFKKDFNTNEKQLLLATGVILALSGIAFFYNRKRITNLAFKKFRKPAINGYVFTLLKGSREIEAFVASNGKYYNVYLGNKFIGKMWQDEHALQWSTDSKILIPLASQIANNIAKVFTRKGFSAILKGTYPEIVSAKWSGNETLEIELNEQTDLEVFATFFKNEVNNLVDFEEHLDILVKKKNQNYFILVGIN